MSAHPASSDEEQGFQARFMVWLKACFSDDIIYNKTERNQRFLEEALELVQANGCSKAEALKLVEYVYDREEGDLPQEVGGVMATLAALCDEAGLDMLACGETELDRVWGKMEQIRKKQSAKPRFDKA